MTIQIIFSVVFILSLLYLLATKGGARRSETEKLRGYDYAHRGLHGNGVAENSLTAFRLAKENGYGIELDVHLLSDGNLAVIHDSSLKRTTGKSGNIEELTAAELEGYNLENTGDTIPTLQEVLELFNGSAPIIVELKAEGGNHAALSKKACELLDGYNGAFCIESFDPRCILWLKKNRPEIIRGQLSQNFFKSKQKLNLIIKFLLTNSLLNFLTKPDFIAYKFNDRKTTLSNLICQKLWKMQMVGWTIRSPQTQTQVLKENWLSIFENFKPKNNNS